MKLSIIVPVYNVEKYVRRCILSIIEQNNDLFSHIELIIVNDGTPDNSVNCIMDLVVQYANIILINQVNQGLSMARNNGMAAAHGDYVWFIDSDDWIAPNSLEILQPLLDGTNDAVVMGVYHVTEETMTGGHNIFFESAKSMTGKEAFMNNCAQMCTAQYTVYRKSFLTDNYLYFMKGVYHEDNELCPKISYLSHKTTYIPNSLYYRYMIVSDGRQSITTVANSKRAFDLLKVVRSLYDFVNTNVIEKDIRTQFYSFMCVSMNSALHVIMNSTDTNIVAFNKAFQDKLFINVLKRGKLKNRIEAALFTMFPNHIVSIYRILDVFGSHNMLTGNQLPPPYGARFSYSIAENNASAYYSIFFHDNVFEWINNRYIRIEVPYNESENHRFYQLFNPLFSLV